MQCAVGLHMIRVKYCMWLTGLTILMLGCKTEVIGGSSGDGGSGGVEHTATSSVGTSGDGGSGGVTTGPTPMDDGPAIAMLYSEIPVYNPSPGSGGVTGGGSTTVDPNTLFIFVSNGAQSCADPHAQPDGCDSRYQISISLPPNLQAVGTYPLENHAFASITEPGGPGACAGGGGSFWDGTIEVTSIDATQVTFTLAGTADYLLSSGGHADGTYTATRCF